ncbi:MAG: hypothetical protein RL609_1659 [Bacteroidota bacterium]|jgi:uncharacterized membrane protein YedE/YeeE
MEKRNKILYWVFTVWLAFGTAFGGVFQLLHRPEVADNFKRLGYPDYFMTLLGTWKILAVIAILIPKYPLIKEWAYAGLGFTMIGAFVSHMAVGDGFGDMFGSILTFALVVVSWYLRPADRRLQA